MAKGKTTNKPTATKRRPPSKQPELAVTRPRRLKLPAYRPFRMKRIKYPEKLPNIFRLTGRTAKLFWQNKRLFIGITVIYALLTLVLVRGFGQGINGIDLKDQLSVGPGKIAGFITSISVLASLITTSSTSANDTSGAYQLILGFIISLATIWGARQVLVGQKVRLRDAFYKGMYPLIPFILVLLVVVLEFLPIVIGSWLYTTVVSSGVAAPGWEQLLWGMFCILLGLASIYMLCSSLFALYIVTLPDMTPLKALRSARQLVSYRRGAVFRKLLYLPVALLVLMCVLMLPVIIFVAAFAPWLFFILTTLTLVMVHLYMYTLYKALLA